MLNMRKTYHLAAIICLYAESVTVIVTCASKPTENDKFNLTIRMSNAVSNRADSLVCTGWKLAPEESYIVKFIPHASKTIAHHMVVYGCGIPASTNLSWTCDSEGQRAVCGDGSSQIVFAWAMDAPEMSLPKDVGMRVSGGTGINYLVVQLHYANAFPPGVTDNSGITLEMTHTRPQQQVGLLVLGNWAEIPPQKLEHHLDSFCQFTSSYPIYPIGYRTHSHRLGVVTSGYRIRDGKWKLIGRMSPQRPQTFYEVSEPGMDIKMGDLLASRCTMNSMSRTTATITGPTNHDEMCNFYIMYSTYNPENLINIFCFKDSAYYTWLNSFKADDIPKDSSSLEGIPEAEQIIEQFKQSSLVL